MIFDMKTEYIKIYIDRLINEEQFEQEGKLPGSILELNETEAKASDINYDISAYLADDHLVMNFDADCSIQMPCKICNELTNLEIKLSHQTLLLPLSEIKKGVFEASESIREQILLNIPPFAECQGNCPEREFVKKFLKKHDPAGETYKPFQGL
jgi:hypothetical protein